MIKCGSCAFENPDDGKFCTGCGQALVRPPAAPEGPAKFCTECGAKIPADSNFCISCGKGFAAAGSDVGTANGGGQDLNAHLPSGGGPQLLLDDLEDFRPAKFCYDHLFVFHFHSLSRPGEVSPGPS
mgnify:CR=1 FL=1